MKRTHSELSSIIADVQRSEFGDEDASHGLLHTMPLRDRAPAQRRRTNASAAASAEPPAPTVYLDTHYNALREEYMSAVFLDVEESSSENESIDDDDQSYRRRVEESVRSRSRSRVSPSGEEEEEADELDDLQGFPQLQQQQPPPQRRQQQHQPHQNPRRCFLCESGNKYHNGVKIKHVEVLHDMFNNGYGLCNKYELARRLHQYQRDYIYGKYGCRLLLTLEMAYAHIIGQHTLSAMLFVGESIDRWKKFLFCAENDIYHADGSRDRGAVADAEKAQKILNQLYTMDVGKMNFNCGKNMDDMKRLGAMHNVSMLSEQAKQLKVRRKRQQQVRALEQAGADDASSNDFVL